MPVHALEILGFYKIMIFLKLLDMLNAYLHICSIIKIILSYIQAYNVF